jgi:excisionase family DNA binding protein
MQMIHLTTDELAERLSVTRHALYKWRARGDGPPFIKISRRKVLYRLADVEAWETDRLRRNTAEELVK